MGQQIRLGDRQARYLSRSVLLEEIGNSLSVRLVVVAGLTLLLIFFVWAYFMPLDEVSSASGEIIPLGQVKKIQHLGGGRLAEILVQEGEYVESGKVLIRLDSTLSRSQLDQTKAQQALLQAKKVRLEAVVEGKLPDFSNIQGSVWIENEKRVLHQVLQSGQLIQGTLEYQVNQHEADLEELGSKKRMLSKKLQLLNEELKMRGELFEKGLNSKLLYLSLQRQLSEMEGELEQIPAREHKLKEKIKETLNRIQEEKSKRLESALSELSSVNNELSGDARLAKASSDGACIGRQKYFFLK